MDRKIKDTLYAHRGYHDKPRIPENSMASFRRGVERGWGAELDVHLLADGTLAVFHDSDLKRCTGAEGILEDLTFPQAQELFLEGTEEKIPSLDQVLELFADSGCPLIIELKTYRGNHRALTRAVCRRLDRYPGEFCLESFDPMAVWELKKFRPAFLRGQLCRDFVRNPYGLNPLAARFARSMVYNRITKPDFVAYCFADRENRSLRRAREKGIAIVYWTVTCREDLEIARKEGATVIFERFDPREEQT